ncbi:copper homeostasis protein CutC [Granulicella sibirica]|uniref:PF03932 family protein CutC n=1 Tax=Granulicella sibirica TaxID=2479048 RepID=A0A4Q0T730_9BACT|nr:copper homeostasis protein CutC [Granulicella sibirica]RXH57839.1 Cytoplasmic copper homeostasis protein cutC [Granulicella sibirica]
MSAALSEFARTTDKKSLPRDEIIFEVCAEDLDACLAARDGGADRIELCSALSEGGLTPSHALIRAAVAQSGLPVFCMLRPRGGNFVYSESEFELMQEDLSHARELGTAGFVAGMLFDNGAVDIERMTQLVELAAPLEMTFHRAFDEADDLEKSLEDVIATGSKRLLTSGGAPDVLSGAERIARLVDQAAGGIAIAVGGGLRLESALQVARITHAPQFHGSVRHLHQGRMKTKASDVQSMIEALRTGRTATASF